MVRVVGFLIGLAVFWPLNSVAGTARVVYKKASPGVVLVLGADGSKAGSGGTGSILTRSGVVLTNAHVVMNSEGRPFDRLFVFLKPQRLTGDSRVDLKRRFEARVVATSPAEELDLAVLQIIGPPEDLPTIPLADSSMVEVGEDVFAIGHPEQGGLFTLTTGVISSQLANFGRVRGKNVFQTSASLNRGNSGGPLLNEEGKMVGVNTAIARMAADGTAITDINFSLKSSVALGWLKEKGVSLEVKRKPKKRKMRVGAPVVARVERPAKVASPRALSQGRGSSSEGMESMEAAAPMAKKSARSSARIVGSGEGGGRYRTSKRPFRFDRLIEEQFLEMEELMGELRGRVKGR